MIVEKSFLTRIKNDFRLNIYEVKIWAALLSRGIATAGELADISGVPRSRCYDVLESLERKGFIIMKIGKPIKYIAVHPEEIVARVKKNVEKDSEESLSLFERLRETDIFKELDVLYKTGIEHVDATDISNSIVGRPAINNMIKKMLNKARSNVVIAHPENDFTRTMGYLKVSLNSLNKKGVNVKVISPVEEKVAKRYNIRNVKNIKLDSRLVIADDELLFVITDDSASQDYETAVWVKSKFFTGSIASMMDKL